MRMVHFYTMKRDDRVRRIAAEHAAYWGNLGLTGYAGGPFDDRSGGLITFEAASREDAEAVIAADPFVREALLETSVIKQWLAGERFSGEE
jgi:uncharacterized protein YciI